MENTGSPNISIRLASEADQPTLLQLAALDSAPVPHAPVLVADLGGEIIAARSLERERERARSIADPFRPTADVTDLLELRARQAA